MNTIIIIGVSLYLITILACAVTAFQMLTGRDRQPYPPKDKK